MKQCAIACWLISKIFDYEIKGARPLLLLFTARGNRTLACSIRVSFRISTNREKLIYLLAKSYKHKKASQLRGFLLSMKIFQRLTSHIKPPTKAMTKTIGKRNASQSPFSALGLFFNQYLAAGYIKNIKHPMSTAYPISRPLIWLC